jgi:micrococcal nuclease
MISLPCRIVSGILLVITLISMAPGPASAQEDRPIGIPDDAEAATVHRVVDGDKVYIRRDDGELDQVLLAGIDAPEPGECYFEESKNYLTDLLPKGQEVYLQQSGSVDRDGKHVVRYVWLPGEGDEKGFLVNTKIVRDGYAGFDDRRDTPRYFDRIRDAETSAREQDRGLWGTCGTLHTDPPPVPFTDQEQAYIDWMLGQIDIMQEANDEIVDLTSGASSAAMFTQAWTTRVYAVIATWDTAYWTAEAKTPPSSFARLHQLWIDTTWHYDQSGQHLATGLETGSVASIETAAAEIELASTSLDEATTELNRILEEHNLD